MGAPPPTTQYCAHGRVCHGGHVVTCAHVPGTQLCHEREAADKNKLYQIPVEGVSERGAL